MNCFATAVILCATLGCIAGCASTGNGADPTIGSVRVYNASEAEVDSAITNAFSQGKFDDMLLTTALGNDFLVRSWHATNGFLLFPGTGSRYYGYFFLLPTVLGTNETKVLVQTLETDVVSGKEPGVHGGWAYRFREAEPDPHQETNVLDAIAAHLTTSQR